MWVQSHDMQTLEHVSCSYLDKKQTHKCSESVCFSSDGAAYLHFPWIFTSGSCRRTLRRFSSRSLFDGFIWRAVNAGAVDPDVRWCFHKLAAQQILQCLEDERRCEFWALFCSCDFMCLICSRTECNEDVWVIEYHETSGIWGRKTARWIQLISILMLHSCVVYSLETFWKTKCAAIIKCHLHLTDDFLQSGFYQFVQIRTQDLGVASAMQGKRKFA